jgi:hypothetical protein
VTVGPVYKIQFHTFLGHTLGGEVFSPQPVIAAADRGSNVVSTVSGYTVTASLSGPSTALLPANQLTAVFSNGLAQFSGMYINQAGSNFIMAFVADLVSTVTTPLLAF